MHPIRRLGCRAYQLAFRAALPVLPYRQPDLLDTLEEVPPLLSEKGIGSILLVADGAVYDLGLTRPLEQALDAAGIARMSRWTLWEVECTYPLFERMKLEIAACGGVVRSVDYGADILLRAAFPAGGAEAFAPVEDTALAPTRRALLSAGTA